MKTRKMKKMKMMLCILCSIAMLTAVLIPMSESAHAATVTWTNQTVAVMEYNAKVSVTVKSTSTAHWTAASGTIYASNGKTVVASKSEKANYKRKDMNIWYDVNSEMNKKLTPGTKYYVQFTATAGKTKYTSPKYSFTTRSKESSTGSVSAFLSDSRWKNGTDWGYYQKPKLNTGYSSKGCCAYCADFVKYVFGKTDIRSGKKYTSTGNIKANDVLHVGGGDGHWLVVLSKNGNSLKVAEGNVSGIKAGKSCVHVSDGKWTITGNSLRNKYESFNRPLLEGYHY